MGWLIVLGIVVLLALLPLGVSAFYNQDGPLVRVILGPFRFTLIPGKKKKPKKDKKQRDSEDKPGKEKKPSNKKSLKEPSQKGGSIKDFLPLVKLGLDFLGELRRKLRVNRLELVLTMAGDDPCDLAVNYGKAWTALGNLMPHLENLFVIRKRNLQIQCDFTADKSVVYGRLDLTITLGRLLSLAVRYGYRGLVEYLKIRKLRKGGAAK